MLGFKGQARAWNGLCRPSMISVPIGSALTVQMICMGVWSVPLVWLVCVGCHCMNDNIPSVFQAITKNGWMQARRCSFVGHCEDP